MSENFVPGHIARSGWLMRQTSILRRWKKSFVIFYTDGRLAFFDDEKASVAEDVINIPYDKAIILGPEYCKDVKPPDGRQQNLLFGIKTRQKSVFFCADSEDELTAWKFALKEAFNIEAHRSQMGSENFNRYTYYIPPGSTIVVDDRGPVINQPDGRMVYICEEPYFRDYSYGSNFCTGMLAGAALGSFMFWPWWFFWF